MIRRHVKAALIDIQRFFRLILFNFITLNDDSHLKNFSLLSEGDEYRLSPAYDLMNTALHLFEPRIFALDKGLFREGMHLTDTRPVRRTDFEEFGRRIGLSERIIKREIDRMTAQYDEVNRLISNSFLSPSLKETYRDMTDYRRKMLTF